MSTRREATIQDLIRCAQALGVGVSDLFRAADQLHPRSTED